MYSLDLSKFVLSFEDYRKYVTEAFSKLDFRDSLYDNIPIYFKDYLKYRNFSFEHSDLDLLGLDNSFAFCFLKGNFFQEKTSLLGFLQMLLDEDGGMKNTYLFETVIKSMSSPTFNLDFYYDEKDNKIKNKIDKVTNEQINKVSDSLENKNKELYEKCVEEFLTFPNPTTPKNDYYHDNLDRMKEVIDNVLTLYYDGAKLHTKTLGDILFSGKNDDFKTIHEFIIKKIHHNETGERVKINEKEYNYLWLELNKIIYLLMRYKS